MADWTAITGIVISGAVGPGLGAWYASRRTATEHEYARVLADRSELRSMLDGAEQVLRRLGRMAGAMQGLFLTHGRSTKERAGEHFDQFREVGREADLQAGRLALRLGREHPVANAYQQAFDGALKIDTALEIVAAEGETADLRTAHGAMKLGAAEFEEAHARYLVTAHALAASQLSPRRQARRRRGAKRGANLSESQGT